MARRVMIFDPEKHAAKDAENLAWLLGVLDRAAKLLREGGFDADALVIEAHRAQLARGENWPGDATKLPGLDEEKSPPKVRPTNRKKPDSV